VAAFIASQREQHGIPHTVSCRALGVSQAWFYKWLHHANAGTLPPRQARRRELAAEVARLFAAHQGKRGSPMIAADLRDAGWRVGDNTVAKLMAGQRLAARPRKRSRSTTQVRQGQVACPQPGQATVPRAAGQPQVVWRPH
jgi:putative transposase